MEHAIEKFCTGIFRSYKTFRHNGTCGAHSTQAYQQWNFEEQRLLTISQFQNDRAKVIYQGDKWAIVFDNKKYFLQSQSPALNYEIITLNHTGLVIADQAKGEKVFFARLPVWERIIKQGFEVM